MQLTIFKNWQLRVRADLYCPIFLWVKFDAYSYVHSVTSTVCKCHLFMPPGWLLTTEMWHGTRRTAYSRSILWPILVSWEFLHIIYRLCGFLLHIRYTCVRTCLLLTQKVDALICQFISHCSTCLNDSITSVPCLTSFLCFSPPFFAEGTHCILHKSELLCTKRRLMIETFVFWKRYCSVGNIHTLSS